MDSPEINTDGAVNEGRTYEFDGFQVDPPNRTVSKNGRQLCISGKAFDVLVRLVENPGRLLTKDELVETVWASSFVEEGSVARTVSTLRKALGDEGKDHKYIATVQGHGYRFVADVRNAENGHRRAGEEPVAAELPHRPIVLWTLAAVVIVVGGGLALSRLGLSFESSGVSYSFENYRLAKLTQTGDVYAPRISPDGQYLAYISTTNNQHSLKVRHNASASTLVLVPDTPSIWAVAIPPDNTLLYYIQKRTDSEKGDLYRIPLLGGVPFKVADDASGGLAVSPDGTELAFVRNLPESNRCSIIVINIDGTDPRTIHSVSYEDMYHAVDWAPDGKSLGVSIKLAQPGGSFKWYLAELNVSGGGEMQIGDEPEMLVVGLEWLPDKSGMIVNAFDRRTKQAQIYHVSYPAGLFRRITNDLDHYLGVSMTADGRNVITMQEEIGRQIWLQSGNRYSRLTPGGDLHIDSVDWIGEDSIAFSEDVNGTRNSFNIWRMRSDGSEKQQLTFGGGYNVELTVSPNERYIAFISRRSGRDQVWRVGVDGSDLVQLTDVDYNVTLPMFSPDSRKVYFLAWVDAGLRLFQVPVEGGEASLVWNDPIYHDWAASPDGEHIAYLTFDAENKRRRVCVFSFKTNRVERRLDVISDTWLRWSADGKALYFTSQSDNVANIWRVGLDGGTPKPITEFADERVFRFAVSPRSGRLAIVRESIVYDAVMLSTDPR